MKSLSITLVFLAVIIGDINADPLLLFPRHMLPSIGTTFNFTFSGLFSTMREAGIYSIQPVIDQNTQAIIGYRNWQLYTGEFTGIFYGVSYMNGTYLQALVDPVTQQCTNVFAETLNCTSWLNTEIIRWDSRCSIVRTDPPITGDMLLTIRASKADLKRPLNFLGTVRVSGSPDETTITYDFLSQSEQKAFPYIKCYF